MLRIGQYTRAFTLVAMCGNSRDWKKIFVHIYIGYYTILTFSSEKHCPFDAFLVLSWPHGPGRCAENGHSTRAFTLVAKWRNSPEWHECHICHKKVVALLRVSDHYNPLFDLLWEPRSVMFMYVTQAPYMLLQRVTYTIYAVTYMGNTCLSNVKYIYIYIYIHGLKRLENLKMTWTIGIHYKLYVESKKSKRKAIWTQFYGVHHVCTMAVITSAFRWSYASRILTAEAHLLS